MVCLQCGHKVNKRAGFFSKLSHFKSCPVLESMNFKVGQAKQ